MGNDRRRRAGLLILAVCLASSCGEASSPVSPSAERVSGVWMGHATLTSVSGGECVGATLQTSLGRRDIFASQIQQTDSSISGTVSSQGNQTSCSYVGTAAGATVSLNMTSCQAGRVAAFRCADGSLRDLHLVSDRVSATAASGGTGMSTSTWNVFASGNASPLGTLTISARFIWNPLGIPHSDFHVFDGSVLPGYVDGTVVIPEEVNPFCERCGWF